MNVLMLSPGYPDEMVWFTAGLGKAGARVFGVGEAPPGSIATAARHALTAYFQVPSLWDEEDAVRRIVDEVRENRVKIDRVECMWEPLVILAAKLREALKIPGMTVEESLPFRDKETMKQVLDAAGVRTPRHARCKSSDERRAAARQIGYPLIIKPIAGAGSADTYRVGDETELEQTLKLTAHVPEVSVEEFIEGDEYTFDTICVDGEAKFINISWYRPKPLIARSLQWVSPQTVALRDPYAPAVEAGRSLGMKVLEALRFQDGFTHMEWFLTPSGEAVFGEIACRPPGARSVEIMNVANDTDLYRGWGEAMCRRKIEAPIRRRYNAAVIFKRAIGEGRIQRIEGLESLLAHYGEHIVFVDLLPVGARRRNWKATLLSDGHLTVRHPNLAACCEIADRVGTDLQLHAG